MNMVKGDYLRRWSDAPHDCDYYAMRVSIPSRDALGKQSWQCQFCGAFRLGAQGNA